MSQVSTRHTRPSGHTRRTGRTGRSGQARRSGQTRRTGRHQAARRQAGTTHGTFRGHATRHHGQTRHSAAQTHGRRASAATRKAGDGAGYRDMINKAAKAYGMDAGKMYRVAKAESGFRPRPNTTDSNARAGTPSDGLFQFTKGTFNDFAGKARKANPAAWKGVSNNWKDSEAQSLTAAWMMTHGLGKRWSTWNRT